MHLFALGANHHSAPISFREKLSFSPEHINSFTASVKSEKVSDGVVVVSTCNRTEIYLASENKIQANNVTSLISGIKKISLTKLHENTYQHNESEVSRHLFRVAAGLDSMAIGEPQILGQLKHAYQQAIEIKAMDKGLNHLFQNAFHVAKEIRTKTRLGDNPISMVHVATKLPRHFYSKFEKLTVLVVGAGETARLATKNFSTLGVNKFIFANRTLSRAQTLATTYHGYAIEFTQLDDHLNEADIVFTATASQELVITEQMISNALNQRKQKIQLYIDLSVPRNVAETKESNAYIYCVDDLKDISNQNQSERQTSAEMAEKLIESYHKDFISKVSFKQNIPLINQVQSVAEKERAIALKYAIKQLEKGDEPKKVIEQLAYSLSKRIAHHPMKMIRHANNNQNADILALIEQIYDGR